MVKKLSSSWDEVDNIKCIFILYTKIYDLEEYLCIFYAIILLLCPFLVSFDSNADFRTVLDRCHVFTSQSSRLKLSTRRLSYVFHSIVPITLRSAMERYFTLICTLFSTICFFCSSNKLKLRVVVLYVFVILSHAFL